MPAAAPTIEIFETRHIEDALDLWRSTEHIGLSAADEPERLAEYLRRNAGYSFAAIEDDRLVGACLCGHDGRRGYVHHLAVAERHRGGGLGATLLDRCLDALRHAGIQKCHAFVFHANPHAEQFWERRGWQRRDELRVYSRYTRAHDES